MTIAVKAGRKRLKVVPLEDFQDRDAKWVPSIRVTKRKERRNLRDWLQGAQPRAEFTEQYSRSSPPSNLTSKNGPQATSKMEVLASNEHGYVSPPARPA